MANLHRLEAPDEILLGSQPVSTPWKVIGNGAKVVKSWKKLVEQCPEDTTLCYESLSTNPMQRIPLVSFPMKGKNFKGGWEYRVTGNYRVFFQPLPSTKEVVVYYADEHPKKNKYPTPPFA